MDELQRRTETRSTTMHDASYERAIRLLTSSEAKKAFAIDHEPDKRGISPLLAANFSRSR